MVLRNEIEVDGVGEVGAETVGSPKLILIRKSDSFKVISFGFPGSTAQIPGVDWEG